MFSGIRYIDGVHEPILGTTIGVAALGALIGTFIKTERWGEVPPATLSLLSERSRLGVALRVQLRI